MRIPVECKNCGLKWLRSTPDFGDETMLLTEIQLFCPKCGSNWCEPVTEEAQHG
jgi:Zn finger protein HypA/HybF involved in hydrogenase expression